MIIRGIMIKIMICSTNHVFDILLIFALFYSNIKFSQFIKHYF